MRNSERQTNVVKWPDQHDGPSLMAIVCKKSEVQFGDYVKRPKRPGEWPDRCDGKCLHLPAGLEQHGKGGHRVERSGAFRKWRSEQERLITRITLPLFLFFSAKCRSEQKHPMTKMTLSSKERGRC